MLHKYPKNICPRIWPLCKAANALQHSTLQKLNVFLFPGAWTGFPQPDSVRTAQLCPGMPTLGANNFRVPHVGRHSYQNQLPSSILASEKHFRAFFLKFWKWTDVRNIPRGNLWSLSIWVSIIFFFCRIATQLLCFHFPVTMEYHYLSFWEQIGPDLHYLRFFECELSTDVFYGVLAQCLMLKSFDFTRDFISKI